MVQQTIDTPEQLVHFQLRSAVTMENDSLAALKELAAAARSSEVKKLFRHHADETREQLDNLGKVFAALELKTTTAPSPSTKGISKQAASLIERVAPKLRDRATLTAALGNEHYEMAVYQGLIVPLTALGASEAVTLLQANLDQETHTSEELTKTLESLATA
jgi:ferritin-like metal-binding protein YciE